MSQTDSPSADSTGVPFPQMHTGSGDHEDISIPCCLNSGTVKIARAKVMAKGMPKNNRTSR